MSDNEVAQVREIGSAKPFQKHAWLYLDAGWFPFPLKPGQKEPDVSGVTGRKNDFPGDERETITDWLVKGHPKSNIGLWLREDVIGIDVDDYDGKPGGKNFKLLEERYGKLPATWISSARRDGVSGIRFFRIPKKWIGKLSWSGKAAEGIDIIQRGHRYAAVWPSWNPNAGSEYQWYRPGLVPDGNLDRAYGLQVVNGRAKLTLPRSVPPVAELPDLPDSWIEFLTRGYVEKSDRPVDMESTGDEIESWAKTQFAKAYRVEDPDTGKVTYKLCRELQNRLDNAVAEVEGSSTSHDKLIAAHWQLLKCAHEGHRGVLRAIAAFEKSWLQHSVKELQNRSLRQAQMELFRSRIEALRKIKGLSEGDEYAKADAFRSVCGCPDPTVSLGVFAEGGPEPLGTAQDPDRYRQNDDGNAQHLVDLYGDTLIWVPGYGQWMLWDGERWNRDDDGLARRCFRMVRDRQEAYAISLLNKVAEAKAAGVEEEEYKAIKLKAGDWTKFARRSGNNIGANGALEAAQSNNGITIQVERLDQNHRLLGVANGVVELLDDGYRLRPAERSDFVTLNTGIPFMDIQQLKHSGGDIAVGRELWTNYLNLFIPDQDLCRFVQKAMGYCLFGGNPERLGIFLIGGTSTGKSTLLNVMMAALGQYGAAVDLGLFRSKKESGGPNPELIHILPRRVITATEAGMEHFSAETFKRITGNDPVTARQMHSRVIVERKPAFVPIIATNSAPTIRGADSALQKRLLPIPFRQQVSREKDSKVAAADLELHAKVAVLHWLVEGWAIYAAEGLDPSGWPEQISEEMEEFVGDLSYEMAFIRDCVIRLKPDDGLTKGQQSVPIQRVWNAFQQWMINNGADPTRRIEYSAWTKLMKANGFNSETVAIPKEEGGGKAKQYIYVALEEPSAGVVKFNSNLMG